MFSGQAKGLHASRDTCKENVTTSAGRYGGSLVDAVRVPAMAGLSEAETTEDFC